MDDSRPMALEDRLHHLAEKIARHGFRKRSALRNKVEKVLRRFHPLHDDEKELVRGVAGVQQLDDARDMGHLAEEANFEGYPDATQLEDEKDPVGRLKKATREIERRRWILT